MHLRIAPEPDIYTQIMYPTPKIERAGNTYRKLHKRLYDNGEIYLAA